MDRLVVRLWVARSSGRGGSSSRCNAVKLSCRLRGGDRGVEMCDNKFLPVDGLEPMCTLSYSQAHCLSLLDCWLLSGGPCLASLPHSLSISDSEKLTNRLPKVLP
ncbi:hypothetical protein Mapa_000168 [Marchantia paleacea]|nr:hypothetical protein Mapa_000168 [Marchantia paleacea]